MGDKNKSAKYRYKDKKGKNKYDRQTLSQNKQRKEAIKIKLKYVLLPYLCLSVMTIFLFGALRWLLDIYLDILPLKESYWNFGIPFCLSVLVVTVWMWPRYAFLKLRWSKNSSSSYFFLTMVLALAIPFIISQNYLSKAAYNVIEVDSLNDIRDYPKQKYFRIDNFELLKSQHASYVDTKVVTDRHFRSNLKIYYYIATPFAAADNVWLGYHYYTSYDNRADAASKKDHYNAFIGRSLNMYLHENPSSISYFKKLKSSNDNSGYLQAVATANEQHNKLPAVILVPESGLFIDSLTRDLRWGFGSFFIGMGVCLLLILTATIDNRQWKGFQKRQPIHKVLKNAFGLLNIRGS